MKFGLLGKSLEHSFSKNYFETKFKKEGLVHSYSNFELPLIEELPALIREHPELKGLNVTIPYKEQVISLLDDISDEAKAIGAVNTICIKNGKLKGFNTDVYGFINSLKPILKPDQKKALILGTGGAAKAVSFCLNKLAIEHHFASRIAEKEELSYQQAGEKLNNYSIIVNTTPLGTFPNVSSKPPLNLHQLNQKHLVYDLIYNPSKTLLLQESEKLGATIKNGLEMLELQANKSWLIWNES